MTPKPDSGTESPRGPGDQPAGAEDDAGIAIEVDAPTAAEPASGPEAYVADLEAKLAAAEAKEKDIYDRLLRTTADLDNLRKRTRKEIDQAKADARQKTLLEVLPVVDNLERAVAHAGEAADAKAIADGVALVLRQFGQALERMGVTPLEAAGKPFDPNIHEAVSQTASPDHPPGTVVAELQKGYMLGDRLLRPALTVVSTGPGPAEEEPAGPNGHDRSGALGSDGSSGSEG